MQSIFSQFSSLFHHCIQVPIFRGRNAIAIVGVKYTSVEEANTTKKRIHSDRPITNDEEEKNPR